jgi:hypothetical protein
MTISGLLQIVCAATPPHPAAIDLLFQSFAADQGRDAICIICQAQE